MKVKLISQSPLHKDLILNLKSIKVIHSDLGARACPTRTSYEGLKVAIDSEGNYLRSKNNQFIAFNKLKRSNTVCMNGIKYDFEFFRY